MTIASTGFHGVPVKRGATYKLSLHARSDNARAPLTLPLASPGGETPRATTINLGGLPGGTAGRASVITLTSASPDDENSLDNPTMISRRTRRST